MEALILGSGSPCFASWLAFHERDAGYLDWFGQDWAIWGLAHTNPVWLLPIDTQIKSHLVAEASGRFFRYDASSVCLVQEDAKTGPLVDGRMVCVG